MAINEIVPIRNPESTFRVWNVSEVYGFTDGVYIPNVGDLVFDPISGFYLVRGVDESTGKALLDKWNNPISIDDEVTVEGSPLTDINESFRIYIDKTTLPHTLACDARVRVYGTATTHVKVFRGTDIGLNGTVISALYDSGNSLTGENIPLELIAEDTLNNLAIKTPIVAHTLYDLEDGEVVTMVVYNDLGKVVSYFKLLVKNTSFIRSPESSQKYVTSIHLDSFFIDSSDERVLKVPVNMTVSEVPMMGIVTYSDGSSLKLPIDGVKFKLLGMEQFVSTVVGQRTPLVLSYTLDSDEYSVGLSNLENRTVTVPYYALTTPYEKAYTNKLFIYPTWTNPIEGYKLNFYLHVFGNSEIINVTDLVTPTVVSDTYSPVLYGVQQKLSFTLELKDVNPTYNEYKFVQSIDLTLLAPGSSSDTKWIVGTPNQAPPYGLGLHAYYRTNNVTGIKTLEVDSGKGSLAEWLEDVYLLTKPLFNSDIDTVPTTPNMFRMSVTDTLGNLVDLGSFTMDKWNVPLPLTIDIPNGSNVSISFFYSTFDSETVLGISEISLFNVIV